MTTITVMGATGRTGGEIVRRLLATQQSPSARIHVRALARSAERLQPLQALGVEVRAGVSTDVAYLTRAFEGSDAVYALMPHDPTEPGYLESQRKQGEAIAQALRASRVRKAVCLSSLGAEQGQGAGVIQSLHEQESRLRDIPGLDVLFLRPGAFFEVYLPMLPSIRSSGMVFDALEPDLLVPMIATRDIAGVAAKALMGAEGHAWRGTEVRELLGPRDLTPLEATRILGDRLGLPGLRYEQLQYEAMTDVLIKAGFAADMAALTVGMAKGLNDRTIRSLRPRDEFSTTPTRFEDFVDELARAEVAP